MPGENSDSDGATVPAAAFAAAPTAFLDLLAHGFALGLIDDAVAVRVGFLAQLLALLAGAFGVTSATFASARVTATSATFAAARVTAASASLSAASVTATSATFASARVTTSSAGVFALQGGEGGALAFRAQRHLAPDDAALERAAGLLAIHDVRSALGAARGRSISALQLALGGGLAGEGEEE